MPNTQLTAGPRSDSDGLAGQDPLRAALEAAGWRFTKQRAAVFDFLRSTHSHPTAEQVYSAVKHEVPRISLATVYKALEALVACDLAAKLAGGDGSARYDCRCDSHYPLRCLATGEARDLETPFDPALVDKLDPSLRRRLEADGFHVTGYRLELLGVRGQASPGGRPKLKK